MSFEVPCSSRWPSCAERTAEEILTRGDDDLISLARPLLADPEWARKAEQTREDEINTCMPGPRVRVQEGSAAFRCRCPEVIRVPGGFGGALLYRVSGIGAAGLRGWWLKYPGGSRVQDIAVSRGWVIVCSGGSAGFGCAAWADGHSHAGWLSGFRALLPAEGDPSAA